jgi:hypothetical protein
LTRRWDPTEWKRSKKLLLGIATIWPFFYMLAFMLIVFSAVFYFSFQNQRFNRKFENIDLIQLEGKIRNGEVSQLTITATEIVACDRYCECEYHTSVNNRATQAEIIRQAKDLDQNGHPRVPTINEETSQPRAPIIFPIGLVVLFAVHFVTIWLMLGLLVLYIVLAIKREGFDQTTRIVWIILICLMGTLAMPVYWYLYVWRDPVVVDPIPSPS